MKRLFTTIFAVAGICTLVSAQKTGLDLGVKVGANLSQIDGKYWENGYKANFLGGAFLGLQGPRFGVQIEGIFSQSTYVAGEGFNELYKDFFNQGKDSIKGGSFQVNYMSIPVLLNVKLLPFLKLQAGPQYSGIVNVKDKERLLKDAKGLFKSGSLDGVLGVWIDLPMRFNAGARYIIGLSNINDNDGVAAGSQEISDAWRQKTLQIHVGYGLF